MKRRDAIKAAAAAMLAGCVPEQQRVIVAASCDPETDGGAEIDAGAPSRILRLGIGQSNQLGYGNSGFAELPHPSRADIPCSRIVYIGGVEYTTFWQSLDDIGHATPPTAPVHWHNAELSSVTRLRDVHGYDVASCIVARGGTGFNFWRGLEVGVSGNLYQKCRDFVFRLYDEQPEEMEGRVILLNVNLGEQSAKYDEESMLYGGYMVELIDALRAHFPAIAHVMITRLHEQALQHANMYTQRIIDHQIAISAAEGYILQDPTPIGPLKGDNAHYTAATGYALGVNEADLWHEALTE